VVQRVVGGPVGPAGRMAWKQGSMPGYRPSNNLAVRKTVVRVYHMEPNNRLVVGWGGEVRMDLARGEDSSAAVDTNRNRGKVWTWALPMGR
jgi:hypothetical protein